MYLVSGVLLAGVAVVLESDPLDAGRQVSAVAVAQEPVELVMNDLHPWIGETAGPGSRGYVGHAGVPEDGSVTLLWHGPADEVQRRILDRARAAGMVMRVEQRRYGRPQLERAGRAILGSAGNGVFAGFSIFEVAPVSARFDGVVVTGTLVREPEEVPVEAEAALESAAAAEFGVAVDVESVMFLPADGG
ncbi:hypothetical protein AB0G04_38480 [Actinoplanes sp. NPDC023801]|uniref:hypothetical protein n=1 Tax=Actinoplanes sp. NPDC023801 TaxID=3154595 RepID=UPI0033DC4F9C